MVDDRHIDREGAGALQCASHESSGQLRVSREPLRYALVQHRDTRRLQHAPAGGARQRRLGVLSLPGTQEVAFAEQLRSETAINPDPADQEALEHQEADAVTEKARPLAAPATPSDPHHRGDAFLDRPLAQACWDRLGQIGVFTQNVTDRLRAIATGTHAV